MTLMTAMILVGCLLFIGLFAGLYALSIRTLNVKARVGGEALASGRPNLGTYVKEQVIRPLGERVPRSSADMSKLEKRLVSAGFRRKDAVYVFYGVQASLALIALLGFAFTGYLITNVLLYPILSVLIGAILPDLWLKWVTAARKDRIQLALPDTLDLLVVSVEAGLGLDQALMRISQEMKLSHRDLSDELQVYNLEVNAGKSRPAALRDLADRTNIDDLRGLAAVLIQTDRFGTSVAQSLRVFSETMRSKRRQRAEERAAKMGVKMIPPMVLFIFPSIFIVVIGPAIIGFVRSLLPFLTRR